jgi:predicted short-subunit dehydrogenase-like oxidoreductase (DUF2520 family)
MTDKPSIGVIGPGKVGATLARLLSKAGYAVQAVYARRNSEAEWLAAYVNGEAVPHPADVLRRCDLILLTVPDDAIEAVAVSLVGDWQGKAVVHTSGARDLDALDALVQRRAMTGSLHPAFPFADVETALAGLRGAAFAVEAADARLRNWLVELVTAVGGQVIEIPAGQKALYHAALVMASNYTVVLYAVAERLLTGLGADKAAADAALNVLMTATVENLKAQGIPDALTGPLTRADTGTLQAHLDALNGQPELANLYVDLARLAYPLLRARGVDIDLIERQLRQGNDE